MNENKICHCVGPDKCGETECIIVRNHRAAADRAQEALVKAMDKIMDKFVAELENCCCSDDEEYQDLENEIVGEDTYIPGQTISIYPDQVAPSLPTDYPSDWGSWFPNAGGMYYKG